MKLKENNILIKSERLDRNTFILIYYDDGSMQLVSVDFKNGTCLHVNEVLKSLNLRFRKLKLFHKLAIDAVDFILLVDKADVINSGVLLSI